MHERSILAHATGHFLGSLDEGLDLLTKLARLNAVPWLVTKIIDLIPDNAQAGPHTLEVLHFLE